MHLGLPYMPNGKPGDHPYTDLSQGVYIFPPPIDELMKEAHRYYENLGDIIGKKRLLSWQSPEKVKEAEAFLRALISSDSDIGLPKKQYPKRK